MGSLPVAPLIWPAGCQKNFTPQPVPRCKAWFDKYSAVQKIRRPRRPPDFASVESRLLAALIFFLVLFQHVNLVNMQGAVVILGGHADMMAFVALERVLIVNVENFVVFF